MTIIDDAMVVLAGLGFQSELVQTQPGFSAFLAKAPNGVSGYLVWSNSNSDDYQFRLARFWVDDAEAVGYVDQDLISAVSRAKSLLAAL